MQLTGKEIIERGIVTGYDPDSAIQQQGIDLRMDEVSRVDGPFKGLVRRVGSTILPDYKPVEPMGGCFVLDKGYYEVIFEEGVRIPDNVAAYLKTRSSLVRCGAQVLSGQFDAGFETPKAGCFLHVIEPIMIERGSRIAQLICHESREVTNTYEGQWQGK